MNIIPLASLNREQESQNCMRDYRNQRLPAMGQVKGLANHMVWHCGCPLTFSLFTVLTISRLLCAASSGEVGDKDDGCVLAASNGEMGDHGNGSRGGGIKQEDRSGGKMVSHLPANYTSGLDLIAFVILSCSVISQQEIENGTVL